MSRYKMDRNGNMVYQFKPSEMVDAATLARGRPLEDRLKELEAAGYTEQDGNGNMVKKNR